MSKIYKKIIKQSDIPNEILRGSMERPSPEKKKKKVLIGSSAPISKNEMNICSVIELLVMLCQFYMPEFTLSSNCKKSTIKLWTTYADKIHKDFGWVGWCKHKIAAFYSYHKDQVIPPAPIVNEDEPKFLFTGGAGRKVNNYLSGRYWLRKESFLQTILQSKKGMPRPDDEMVEYNVGKTFKELTEARYPYEPRGNSIIHEFPLPEEGKKRNKFIESIDIIDNQTLKEQLQRTVEEILKDVVYKDDDHMKMFFPSTSANYVWSRNDAGSLQEIRNLMKENPELENLMVEGGWLKVISALEVLVTEDDILLTNPDVTSDHSGTLKKKVLHEEHLRQEIYADTLYSSHELKEKFKQLMEFCTKYAMTEKKFAELVGLPEALKVRVITKGPPVTNFVLRNLWKTIHSKMRKMKTFKLIGTTVSELQVLDALGKRLDIDEIFISGDYQNATNMLKSWVSDVISEQISKNLNLEENFSNLFKDSLTGYHIIDTINDLDAEQTNGQLMGSITSFPVLCIANAACCRWALELTYKKKIMLNDSRLMVNGDDCVFIGKESTYTYWKRITSQAGLNESIGKTFKSNSFLNINSMNFTFTKDEEHLLEVYDMRTGKIRKTERLCPYNWTPYINAGILLGLKRSGGKVSIKDQHTDANLAARSKELIRGLDPAMAEAVMNKFVECNWDLLEKFKVPWYMPEDLGGLGLANVQLIAKDYEFDKEYQTYNLVQKRNVSKHQPSELDKRILTSIILKNKDKKSRKPKKVEKVNEWRTREVALKTIKKELVNQKPREYLSAKRTAEVERYEQLINVKSISLLFDSRFSIDDLYKSTTKEGMKKMNNVNKEVYKSNEKLWQPKNHISKNGLMNMPTELRSEHKTYIFISVADMSEKYIEKEVQLTDSEIKSLIQQNENDEHDLLYDAGGEVVEPHRHTRNKESVTEKSRAKDEIEELKALM